MDLLARLSNGRKLVFGAGLLLFIDSFLSWNSVSAFNVSISWDAWATGRGKLMGWLLIILLVWEGVLLAVNMGKLTLPELPVPAIIISLALGALVVLFGLLRVFQGGDRAYGAWIGLILLIGLAAGLFLRWQEGESTPARTMAPPASPPPAPPAGPME